MLEGDGGAVGERERGTGEGDGVRNPKACIYMCVLVTGLGRPDLSRRLCYNAYRV